MEKLQEIAIGETLNEENEKIFNEFMEEFEEYIDCQSCIQTALLGEKFFENEAEVTEKMKEWLGSKGVGEDAWGFQ